MSIELLLLVLLGGITVLAYMVAINSHGPTRLSISYLLATILLAVTVWAVVQHFNSGLNRERSAEMRKLEDEKQLAEERVRNQEVSLRQSQGRTAFAGKLSSVITEATGLSTTMMNVDLRALSLELEALVARASSARATVVKIKEDLLKLQPDDSFFSPSVTLLNEAAALLEEAAQYYQLYYRSEDTAQEELRERLMRQRARAAFDKCQKAGALIASSN